MEKKELEALKAQYGQLYCASLVDNETEETTEIYLKPIDRQTFSIGFK